MPTKCMAFDHGAVDFIAKSRGRGVLVRRLRNVVEFAKPKAKSDLPVPGRVACDRLVPKPGDRSTFWNGVDANLQALGEYKLVHLLVSEDQLLRDLSRCLRSPAFEGFIAGSGNDGFRANVRRRSSASATSCAPVDPPSTRSRYYSRFGYGWRRPPR